MFHKIRAILLVDSSTLEITSVVSFPNPRVRCKVHLTGNLVAVCIGKVMHSLLHKRLLHASKIKPQITTALAGSVWSLAM